jgi:hypothetical protein
MGQKVSQNIENGTVNPRWRGLYKTGGVAALIIAVLLIGEIAVYSVLPRSSTAAEHFAVFNDNWLAGLLTFDLLGMIAYILFIPTILALYLALRRNSESIMLMATILFFVGITDFLATNTSFSMLSLSHQYAAATTDAERSMFLAAGQTMLTLFNENAFLVSYVIVSAAWTMISIVMLRSHVFSRITAYAGILAGSTGIIAVVLEHVSSIPVILTISIALYFAAIVFLFIWVVLTGRRLLRFGTNIPPANP